ncbi:hypothetical protein ACGC1H_003470 [Rhizoctonia solani]
MSNRPIPATFSAIREWEIAGLSLSGTLENYMDLSTNLGNKALRENIHPKHTITRMDSALQSLHPVLTQQLNIAHSTLARTRNQLASIVYCLPREILSEIFMGVVYVYSPIDHDTANIMPMEVTLLNMFRNLYSLQSVCHLWRDIILSQGVFWHFVPAYCTDIPALRCTQATDLTFQRSNADLHLAVVAESHLPAAIRTLKTFSRFRRVNIAAETRTPIVELIERLIGPGPPLILSELSLYEKVVQYDHFQDNAVQIFSNIDTCWNSFCKLINSLSILRVRGAHFTWNHMTFSHRLVELQIQDVKLGPDEDFARFLKRLSLASSLRDLRFISVWSSFDLTSLGDVRPERNIHFPHLKSLFLADLPYNTLFTIMDHISPGSYHRTVYLTAKCTEVIDEPTIELTLESLCDHFEGESYIDTLVLSCEWDQEWLSDSELHALLCSLDEVKTLKLRGWTLGEDELQAILGPEAEGSEPADVRFPELEYLDLSRVRILDEEGLKEIVSRHPIQRMLLEGSIDKGPDESFEFIPILENEPIVDWLRLNVPNFTLTSDTTQPSEYSCFVWQAVE